MLIVILCGIVSAIRRNATIAAERVGVTGVGTSLHIRWTLITSITIPFSITLAVALGIKVVVDVVCVVIVTHG